MKLEEIIPVAMAMYGRYLLQCREACGEIEPWELCTCPWPDWPEPPWCDDWPYPSGQPGVHDEPCPRAATDDAWVHWKYVHHECDRCRGWFEDDFFAPRVCAAYGETEGTLRDIGSAS